MILYTYILLYKIFHKYILYIYILLYRLCRYGYSTRGTNGAMSADLLGSITIAYPSHEALSIRRASTDCHIQRIYIANIK